MGAAGSRPPDGGFILRPHRRRVSVRTIFFDYGGTLARTWTSDGRTAAELWGRVLERRGLAVPAGELTRALAETDLELSGRIYRYVGRTPEFWELYESTVLGHLGLGDPPSDLVPRLRREFDRASRGTLFPETLTVLGELHARGIALGVISNHHDGLREILAYHGLDRLVPSVTYSQEVGAEKPDRRVFDRALARVGHSADQAMHVGDSWKADYLGARAVGLRAIWLNRRGGPPPEPCAWVRDLSGVLALVGP